MSKFIICCDFDGVLHSYESGWQGDASIIKDDPVPGALDWLVEMTGDDNFPHFEIAVYSSRSKEPEGIEAMKAWLQKHLTAWQISKGDHPKLAASLTAMRIADRLTFPTQKPAASLMIDDRAFHFQGQFPTVEWMRDFKPWNKIVNPTPKFAMPRPEASRIQQIREAWEDDFSDSTDVSRLDSADRAIGDLLAEIDHLQRERGPVRRLTMHLSSHGDWERKPTKFTLNGRENHTNKDTLTYEEIGLLVGLTGIYSVGWVLGNASGTLRPLQKLQMHEGIMISAQKTDGG